MPQAVALVNEYRGEVLDLIHYGYICVVDENSNVIYHAGDPEQIVFFRSASKPIQALPVIARRLDEKYGLTDEETALFAGSHQGDTFHVAAVESMLRKAGLTEDMMVMNPAYPQVNADKCLEPRKAYHNCSGKHVGAMLLQKETGGDARDYWREDSPAQAEIKRAVAAVSEFPEERIKIGLDGCGVPVFAVAMKNIAAAFKNLACPEKIACPDMRRAAERFVPRMHAYPHMIKGLDTLCTDLNRDDRIVAKGGAGGVYGIGLKDRKLGVAIKMQDGTNGMWPIVIQEILRYLGYENEETLSMLEKRCPHVMINDNGTPCGRRECVFELIQD